MTNNNTQKKIESLTEEQLAALKKFAEERITFELAIRPTRKVECEIAIKRMYEISGHTPKPVEWLPSPYAAAQEAAKRNGGKWHSCFTFGSMAGSAAYGAACRDILGLDLGEKKEDFALIYDNIDSQVVVWMNTDFCLASERPVVLKLDEEGRMHGEDGPAIQWSDGYGQYFWHGTAIPKEWIENRHNLDPTIALTHEQIEQRRAAAEIIGWRKVLEKLSPRVVDKDSDPMIGELLEVDLPDSPGSRFLRVLCGTGREFVLSVPRDMKTALEANAWTYNMDPNMFRQYEFRT